MYCITVVTDIISIIQQEYICFKREVAVSISSGKPLKLVDKFTYLSSNISSAESYVNIRLIKVWTAIDRLSIYGSLIYLIKENSISSCLCHL